MSNQNHTKYVEQLADTLIAKGRRYGLSTTYRNDMIRILGSVPYPEASPATSSSPEQAKPAEVVSKPVSEQVKEPVANSEGMEKSASAPELPSDEQVLAAVQATADKPAEVQVEVPTPPKAEENGEEYYLRTRSKPEGVSLSKFR